MVLPDLSYAAAMFGTLEPRPCALPSDDRLAWRRLYCGTCKGLGEHHSIAHRALLSHDVVLLAGIVEGVQGGESPCGTCRCPIAPLIHRPILEPDSPSMRVASAVQVLLADEWLADRAQDGSALVGWARPLLEGSRSRAVETLTELGVDLRGFDDLAARQAALEVQGETDLARAAAPTAELLGRLVGSTARLPDTEPSLATAASARSLQRLGEDLGRVIYALDALDDLEDDARGGAFNPCLTVSPTGLAVPDAARVEAAIRFVEAASARLTEAVRSFPWRRGRGVIEHVVAQELPRRVGRTAAAARDTVTRATSAELQRWHAAPWWRRWWWLATGWLLALSDRNAERRERGKRRQRRENSGDDCMCGWLECCVGCDSGCCDCACCCMDADGDGACCECCGGCDGCDCGGCDCSP
jgi:hypothetical protein